MDNPPEPIYPQSSSNSVVFSKAKLHVWTGTRFSRVISPFTWVSELLSWKNESLSVAMTELDQSSPPQDLRSSLKYRSTSGLGQGCAWGMVILLIPLLLTSITAKYNGIL